ncbi:MAG: redoxin domain-containing protein [Longimicrobiales bacterium]|nr:redoxin domain-containing protein [Longimicrobiales bacterium]
MNRTSCFPIRRTAARAAARTLTATRTGTRTATRTAVLSAAVIAGAGCGGPGDAGDPSREMLRGEAPAASDLPSALGPVDGRDLPGADLERIRVGMEAPDFALESYGGDVVRLSDYRGRKAVILVFYRGHW